MTDVFPRRWFLSRWAPAAGLVWLPTPGRAADEHRPEHGQPDGHHHGPDSAPTPFRPEPIDPSRVQVVASFSILADLLHVLGGDAIQVHSLVGPNSDAHVFEPTPAAVGILARAALVATNGLGFEGWMDRLTSAAGYRGRQVVASEGVRVLRQDHGIDPHAWHDLDNLRQYVHNLARALGPLLPGQSEPLAARERAYLARLDTLQADSRRAVDALPDTARRVITTHEAFGYFGRFLGIEFMAPTGWSTGAQPSAAVVARLIRQIRQERVRALFLENTVDPRLMRQIAQESGARIGGTLYGDALSTPDGPASTFLKLYAHNVENVIGALGD